MKPSLRLLSAGAMGFEFAISVVLGLVIGLKADEWFDSSPIGVLLGVVMGLVTATVRLIKYLQLLNRGEHSGGD